MDRANSIGAALISGPRVKQSKKTLHLSAGRVYKNKAGQDAYLEGYAAASKGRYSNQNPYAPKTEAQEQWALGYQEYFSEQRREQHRASELSRLARRQFPRNA